MYRCEILNEFGVHKSSIESFLDDVSNSSISVLGYHYPLYLEMLENIGVGKIHAIVVKKGDRIVGFLPGFIKTSKLGSVYSSLPFFGPNAGLIYASGEVDAKEIHKEVFDSLMVSLKQLSMVSASFYTPFQNDSIFDIYEKNIQPTAVVNKFTSYVDLNNLQLNTSLQYDIRKALKSGVRIETRINSEVIASVYSIYIKNCEDYGIPPKPFECINSLMSQSSTDGVTETYLAYSNEQLIGALIMIYSKGTASYYLPCSVHEFRSLQPTTLLIKHAMDRSIAREIKIWNWESSPSKDSGVFKFKMKWGSVDGSYKIYIRSFKDQEFYKSLGQEEISRNFPFFFVYPFNLL